MKFTLLGICYDKTQTLRKGASKGPYFIRKKFPKLETQISGVELEDEASFFDLGDIYPKTDKELEKLTFEKMKLIQYFPVIIGGEHTITRAVSNAWNIGLPFLKTKPKTYVFLDAHPDMEDSNGHDGTIRRIKESGNKVVLYGVRVFSEEEKDYMKSKKIKFATLNQIKRIKGPVYLSIDLDILDPSILCAVGNPEPDGLKFKDVVEIVRILSKNLVGIDFVEYTPFSSPENEYYSLTVANLIYHCLAQIVKANK